MRWLLLSLALLAAIPAISFAQGDQPFCKVRDEKTTCRFRSMDECNASALRTGGYCRENYNLYGNKGNKLFCLANRYGLRCLYNNKTRCVNEAARWGGEAACIENYMLSAARADALKQRGAGDCDAGDIGCQVGAAISASENKAIAQDAGAAAMVPLDPLPPP